MRAHRYTLDVPHAAARLWALLHDHDRLTAYAPTAQAVEVVWPGDQFGNGRLRRIVHRLALGRTGTTLELVTDVAKDRGYTFTVLSHRPGDERTGSVRLEPLGRDRTRLHVEERFHLATAPGRWFEGRIHDRLNQRSEETMRAASQWLTDHPEYRPDLAA